MLLHPHFLWGLTGAIVPVLIHLLARRRARRVPFPSLRLLRAAERKRRALARLHQPLVLLLRVLALALVALALATPLVGPLPAWFPLPHSRWVAVIVDDTLSMAGGASGITAWSKTKAFLDRFLSALGSGDRVALISLSSPQEAPWLTPQDAKRRLGFWGPTALGGKVGPALACAGRILDKRLAPNRAVLVVTDLQASAWNDPLSHTDGLRGVPILIRDVGDKRAHNLAVTDVQVEAGEGVVGRPVRLDVTTSSLPAESADRKPQKVVVQLRLRDRPLAASEQFVGDKAPAITALSFRPEQARDIVACVALAGGPFGPGLDDFRYCTVRVRRPVRVLAASPGKEARYVATALDPFHDPTRTGMEVRTVSPQSLEAALAAAWSDAVVLANCPRLSQAATEALAASVSSGQGLLLLLGDEADVEYLSRRLLPKTVGDHSVQFGPIESAAGSSPFALAEIDTAHRPLSVFSNPRAGNLRTLRFTKMRRLRVGDEARVLANFDNGVPALVEWQTSSGHVILFNTSADHSWGEHIRSAAYVPLMHHLVRYLAKSARPYIPDILVGERPVIMGARELPTQVRVRTPAGEEQMVAVQDGCLPEMNAPGEYRVSWGLFDLAFAANTDPRESDLARADERCVRAMIAPLRPTLLPPETTAEETAANLPRRADLSVPLLLLGLVVLLAESVLSTIRQRRETVLTATRDVPI